MPVKPKLQAKNMLTFCIDSKDQQNLFYGAFKNTKECTLESSLAMTFLQVVAVATMLSTV